MKTVHDLAREQLIELKQRYLTRLDEEGTLNEVLYNDPDDERGLSQGELEDADNLVPDDVIFNEYEGTMFYNDDFFCTAGQDE